MELPHVISSRWFALVVLLLPTCGGCATALTTTGSFEKTTWFNGSYGFTLYTGQHDYFFRTCLECASICLNVDVMPACRAFQCDDNTVSVSCDFYKRGPLQLFNDVEVYVFKVFDVFHSITLGHRRFSIYMSSVMKTFLEARAHCNNLGGYLLQFDSQDEYDAVKLAADGNQFGAFVGLNDFAVEGRWVMDRDDQPTNASNLNWEPGQPNGEDCGFEYVHRRILYDRACAVPNQFLCERDIV